MKKTAIFCFLPTLAFAGMLGTSQPANACGTEAYIGETCITAAGYCPRNTVEAYGQLLTVIDNEALFSLVGCTFGGDCRTSFGVPDLRGRAPVSYGQGPGLYYRQFGQYYGTEEITQTITQMPEHNHTATFTPSGGGGGGSGTDAKVMVSQDAATTDSPAGGKYLAKATTGLAPIKIYNDGTNLTELEGVSGGGGGGGGSTGGTVTVDKTGGGQPMDVAGPRLALRYCIVTDGLYPPRP